MNKWKLIKKEETNYKITFRFSWNPEEKKQRKKTKQNKTKQKKQEKSK